LNTHDFDKLLKDEILIMKKTKTGKEICTLNPDKKEFIDKRLFSVTEDQGDGSSVLLKSNVTESQYDYNNIDVTQKEVIKKEITEIKVNQIDLIEGEYFQDQNIDIREKEKPDQDSIEKCIDPLSDKELMESLGLSPEEFYLNKKAEPEIHHYRKGITDLIA